ncbi:MAG: hypothetical protein IKF36_05920 [Bacilli bacterium]|nr:hypothetical protein [Bacilli bacterium]
MKKSTLFGLLAVASLCLGLFFCGVFVKDINGICTFNLITCIAAVVFAIIGIVSASKEKSSKALSIVMLVLGILGTLAFLAIFGFIAIAKDPKNTKDICKDVVQCKKDKDGVSTCHIKGDDKGLLDIKCYDSVLKEDQYKD